MSNWAKVMNSCFHKIHQSSLNDCWSKLLWHKFYLFLSYGFSYSLQPKAEVFQGRTFGYGRRWKLRLRSNTELLQIASNWPRFPPRFLSRSLYVLYATEVFVLTLQQRYTYRVLQTIQMKLIILGVWAEPAVLGSTKTALKFKNEIQIG